MHIIEALRDKIESTEAKFISLKYLGREGGLRQIDIAVRNLVILEDCILVNNIKLRPISEQCFIDPFRSYITLFCLCDNLSEQYNPRLFLQEILGNNNVNSIEFELGIHFVIVNKSENIVVKEHQLINYQNQVEPYDQLANLRAEILDILEKIGIPTIYHCHAHDFSSCSIIIKAHNFLNIADYLVITNFIIQNVAESYGKIAYFLNNLKNDLYLVFSEQEDNKKLATAIISNIIHNLENSANNGYFVNQVMQYSREGMNGRQIGSDDYHRAPQNSHKLHLKLRQAINPYLAMSYLIVYGFDNQLIGKPSEEILASYFKVS